MAKWYAYSGNGDPFLSPNYRATTVKPICTTGEEICAIYLSDNDEIPAQFDGMTTYIANALVTLVPQPTGVGVRRFVYLRAPIS
ncbi:hypothetical protein SAMN05421820_103384 [Pedobacter steynii]|uniref:Uncharacterized protein n=1 Tax=Pedobacter steynii TaxID=430522 RepID=A0A1G9RWC4_9SPHI|nr:hypothetical protein [Pedobacter steynii]NQX37622.1 hypothetical protein [Pedobacter steynii]SDM27531.1 hypothetical protein SAMN05421820_103384 [Pedobacter steynii]